jgi:hypothetical protein
MKHCVWFVAAAFCIIFAATVAAQQPNYGCLAFGNCGQKGNTPNAGPRDYWQNWICSGCHLGVATNYVQSPPERALLGVPSRFWTMHADAVRDGETRVRVGQHRLLPANRISPGFQQLLSDRTPRR